MEHSLNDHLMLHTVDMLISGIVGWHRLVMQDVVETNDSLFIKIGWLMSSICNYYCNSPVQRY